MNLIKTRKKNQINLQETPATGGKPLFNGIINNPLKTAWGLVLLEFISSLRACPQRKVRGKAVQNG